MAPWRRDQLKKLGLSEPVAASALVVRGDPGYSAASWWTASLLLRVTAPGLRPVLVEHECRATREKTPFTGLTVPVAIEREDPTQVRIRWNDVPPLERRIAERYPSILSPRSAWRDVLDADPSQADRMPDWGEGEVANWPVGATLRWGRCAGTAIVLGHSWDPAPYTSGNGFGFPGPRPYRYGGRIRTSETGFLGWLLLLVIPPEGDRYGVHLRTMIRRDRLAPVLPVAIRPSQPTDIQIAWDDAPEVAPAVAAERAPRKQSAQAKPRPSARKPAASKNGKVARSPNRRAPGSRSGKPSRPKPKSEVGAAQRDL